MSIYINDAKKQTVRHYCTTPKIEKAIEALLNEMEDIVSSETYEGIEVTTQEIPEYRRKPSKKSD